MNLPNFKKCEQWASCSDTNHALNMYANPSFSECPFDWTPCLVMRCFCWYNRFAKPMPISIKLLGHRCNCMSIPPLYWSGPRLCAIVSERGSRSNLSTLTMNMHFFLFFCWSTACDWHFILLFHCHCRLKCIRFVWISRMFFPIVVSSLFLCILMGATIP